MKLIQAILLYCLSIHIIEATDNSIFYAVQQNDTKALENILKQNSTNTQLNQDGQTILHVAVLANNWKAVKAIIQSGFTNINQLDKNGKTAMDYATEHSYNKIVRKLYKNQGKVTSIENATNAKKAITQRFKTLFFVSLPFVIISAITAICIPFADYIVGGGLHGPLLYIAKLLYIIIPTAPMIIPMTIGIIGWTYRSRQNLLLTEPYTIS